MALRNEYMVSFDEGKNITSLICHVMKWAMKVKTQVLLEHIGVSHNPALGGDRVRGVFLEYLNKIFK